MIRRINGAWVAAFGASMLMMAATAHGAGQKAAQKPAPTKKAVTAKAPAKPAAPLAPKTPTTTLTGCLRMDGQQFKLTNLKGSEVQAGRNWKTGFIKKSSKKVEVVGASTSVKLKDHVGREVSVVGTRADDTHLRASSIRRVATACS
jgi:hypothetical protein